MRLSVAPVLPVWLIVGLVICVGAIRVTAFIATRHRHAETIGRKAWIRLGLGLAAILCLGIAALRPGDEYQAERPPRPIGNAEQANANVFLVIDRSMQMLANDFVGEQSRMAAVTADLDFVIRTYPGARFEVISYADSARVEWPLSADAWSLLPFVANFDAYGGPDAEWDDNGTRATIVSAQKGLLRDKLNQATHAYPGSGNLIYIFGSGSGPGDWTLEMPRGQVSGGAVFGYGTEQGGYLPDEDADATFRLNEPAMRTGVQPERSLLSAARRHGVAAHADHRGVVGDCRRQSRSPCPAPEPHRVLLDVCRDCCCVARSRDI
jgi:hypothetical protein